MKMLLSEPLHRGKRLVRLFHDKIKLTKDLRDQTGGTFVWAEQ
jgi:hypothetical protein